MPIQVIKNSRSFKASGLIEMLIAMAIFAIAIVSITALNAKNYQQIKTNEITDIANRIMVSNLEFMKAPTTTTNLGSSNTGIQQLLEPLLTSPSDVVCFRPTAPLDNISTFDVEQIATSGLCPNKLTDCSTTNDDYRLSTPSNTSLQGLWICNQIIVRMDPVQRGYVINSVIAYKTPKSATPVVNEIIGFRPFTYE